MRTRPATIQWLYFALLAAFFVSATHYSAFADAPKPAGKAVAPDVGILGFHFAKSEKHTPEVADVFADTPAAQADLKQGDLIIEINSAPTKDLDKEKIYQLLSGKPDTKVVLKVERNGKTLSKSLTRMHSVEFAKAHPDIWKKYVSTM